MPTSHPGQVGTGVVSGAARAAAPSADASDRIASTWSIAMARR